MRNNFKRGAPAFFVTVLLLVSKSGCSPVFWVKKYLDMPDVGPLEALELNDRVAITEKKF